ncbi:uncharacterized protein AB675_6012 [Cyphellophora attinorum]|uniref:Heterokaryon incompatibility domain-containing protein n=1 Tax=Cyphellophora attinorum TaxID=1664694 RepID=A0A0N1NYK9_9EURO|nr:uncharacterized protein AB675_6012 [Phialophora attinorum]KPI36923.1 hypothetical protein AB675_6012 [Phialophora attinorum]
MAANTSTEQSATLRQIAQDAPDYKGYLPLDENRQEIRVLYLEDNSTCTIRHVSLLDSPVYYALSYCWGPPTTSRELTIKSAEHSVASQVVPVRTLVAEFLKSLYKQYGSITIWLDVICINQRSFEEQNAQVALMGGIYKRAKAVYAWMGAIPHPHPYLDWLSKLRFYNPSEDSQKMKAAFETLFNREYWSRVWIIQECALNRELFLICDSLSLDWGQIQRAGNCYPLDRDPTSTEYQYFQRFNNIRDVRDDVQKGKLPSLVGLVLQFEHSRCGDPLDKVYGIRALARDGHSIPIDYKRSLYDLFFTLVSMRTRNWSEKFEDGGGELSRLLDLGRALVYCLFDKSKDDGANDNEAENYGAGDHQARDDEAQVVLNALQDQRTDCLMFPVSTFGNEALFRSRTLPAPWKDLQDTLTAKIFWTGRDTHSRRSRVAADLLISNSGHILDIFLLGRNSQTDFDLQWKLVDGLKQHVWVCNINQAVHFSRRLYALLLVTLGRTKLGTSWDRILKDPAGLARSLPTRDPTLDCGCEPTVLTVEPSPWPYLGREQASHAPAFEPVPWEGPPWDHLVPP